MFNWLHQKPADLDLHYFQKQVSKFENKDANSALIRSNTVKCVLICGCVTEEIAIETILSLSLLYISTASLLMNLYI